jgi:hypothetical protein
MNTPENKETEGSSIDHDLVCYIETKISDCGTADGLAEIACNLLLEAERLDRSNLHEAYKLLRAEVIFHSGISSDISYDVVDQAIRNCRV